MRVVVGPQPRLIAWAEQRLGAHFRDDARALGVVPDLPPFEIVGALVFDTFSTTWCCLHIAGGDRAGWLCRELLVHAALYVRSTGLARLTALISEHNAACLRLARHAGFADEGRMRAGGSGGEDLIMLGFERADIEARYLTPRSIERAGRKVWAGAVSAG